MALHGIRTVVNSAAHLQIKVTVRFHSKEQVSICSGSSGLAPLIPLKGASVHLVTFSNPLAKASEVGNLTSDKFADPFFQVSWGA